MKTKDLVGTIREKGVVFFSFETLRKLFPDESKEMKTIVSRMVENGTLERIYKGWYSLKDGGIDIEEAAQRMYYPSYLSFELALSKYGIINQGPNTVTLATTRHSKIINTSLGQIICRQIKRDLFGGFNLVGGIYLAEAEKAVVDTLYLNYLGKLKTNTNEWDWSGLKKNKIRDWAKLVGKNFGEFVESKRVKS